MYRELQCFSRHGCSIERKESYDNILQFDFCQQQRITRRASGENCRSNLCVNGRNVYQIYASTGRAKWCASSRPTPWPPSWPASQLGKRAV